MVSDQKTFKIILRLWLVFLLIAHLLLFESDFLFLCDLFAKSFLAATFSFNFLASLCTVTITVHIDIFVFTAFTVCIIVTVVTLHFDIFRFLVT